jgi:hypothetical protein
LKDITRPPFAAKEYAAVLLLAALRKRTALADVATKTTERTRIALSTPGAVTIALEPSEDALVNAVRTVTFFGGVRVTLLIISLYS